MAGFFDTLLQGTEAGARDVSGFFNNLLHPKPQALGNTQPAVNNINAATGGSPVQQATQAPATPQATQGNPVVGAAGAIGGPVAGFLANRFATSPVIQNLSNSNPTQAGIAAAGIVGEAGPEAQGANGEALNLAGEAKQAGGFFSNLLNSAVKKLGFGDTNPDTAAQTFQDGQKVMGTPEVIDAHTAAVGKATNSPMMANFDTITNPKGPDTLYTFENLKNPEGLQKTLLDQGVAASIDQHGNVVVTDTDNAAKGIINQVTKENYLDPPTAIKGDAHIMTGDQYDGHIASVQSNAEGAPGALPNQSAENSGGIQNPAESAQSANSSGANQQQVLNPITQEPVPGELTRGTPGARQAAGLPSPVEMPTEEGAPTQVTPGKALSKYISQPELDTLLEDGHSASAKVFGQRFQAIEQNWNDMAAPSLTKLEDARAALSKSDLQLAVDVLEGKTTSDNPAVMHWVETAKSIEQDIANKSEAVNLMTRDANGNLRPFAALQDYFPHYSTSEVVDAAKGDDTALVKKLMDSGKFQNENDVRAYLQEAFQDRAAATFGHIEQARTAEDLPYTKDPQVLEKYVTDAYKRIATANQFGAMNGDAQRLIQQMQGAGDQYGAQAATKLLDRTQNLEQPTLAQQGVSNFSRALRTAEQFMKLPLVAIKHATQLAQIMAQDGPLRTLAETPTAIKALVTGDASDLSRNASMALHEAVARYDPNEDASSLSDKFMRATGLPRLLNAWRDVASNAASDQFDSFVANPTAKAERYFARAGLNLQDVATQADTTSAKNQYINSALSKSSLYFREGDLPAGWQTGLGKVLTYFKAFGYNEMVKGIPPLIEEAKSGNVTPLLTLMTVGTALGAGAVDLKDLIEGKKLPSVTSQLVQGAALGVGGLAGETAYQAIANPKYLGSQVVGAIGGPVASDIYNAAQDTSSLLTGSKSQQQTAINNIVSNIPGVGQIIANRVAPALTDAIQGVLPGKQSSAQVALDNIFSGAKSASTNPFAPTAANTGSTTGTFGHGTSAQSQGRAAQARTNRAGGRAARSAARRGRATASKIARTSSRGVGGARGVKVKAGGRRG